VPSDFSSAGVLYCTVCRLYFQLRIRLILSASAQMFSGVFRMASLNLSLT